MKVDKGTSAVEGVGSSRRKNTSAKTWLEYLSLKEYTSKTKVALFQVYTTQPAYSYCPTPMRKNRSLGQFGTAAKPTKSHHHEEDKQPVPKGNTINTRCFGSHMHMK